MNLEALTAAAIAAVNPNVSMDIQVSNGYTTQPDGSRVPSYLPTVTNVIGQLQPLTFRDIQQVEGLNLQGTRRAIYISGEVDGLIRPNKQGGDLITTTDGNVWLVAMVLEQWPDWCKVVCTLQTDGSVT